MWVTGGCWRAVAGSVLRIGLRKAGGNWSVKEEPGLGRPMCDWTSYGLALGLLWEAAWRPCR